METVLSWCCLYSNNWLFFLIKYGFLVIPTYGFGNIEKHSCKWSCQTCLPTYYLSRYAVSIILYYLLLVNTRQRQNWRHFPDIFKCIIYNENIQIVIKISLKLVTKGQINNIPALVQTMAWRPPVNEPFSEPMMQWLPTYMHHSASVSQKLFPVILTMLL